MDSREELLALVEEEKKEIREKRRESNSRYLLKRNSDPEKRLEHLEQQREYSSTNKDLIWQRRKATRKANRLKAIEYLGGKCSKCEGVFESCVYDFHHKDMSTKEKGIHNMWGNTWEYLLVELAKCILLCSNCHRVEHYSED